MNYPRRLSEILHAQSAQPELVGTYDTAGTALHVRMRSGVAYLADGNAGVVSLSVADPSRPTLLGRYDTPNGAQYLRLAQGQLYVADSGSLLALNIAAPSHLTLAASVSLEPASALIQLQIVGDLIYMGDLHSGLYVVRRKPAAFITQYVYLPQLQRH